MAPKLRFKGYNDPWQSNKIGDVINNKSGKYNPEKDEKSYKCIELEHLSTNTGRLLGYIESIKSSSIKNKFQKGDVLFGKLRPYLRKHFHASFEGVCSSEIWVLNGKNIVDSFLYMIIQRDYFIELANQSTGSKMPRADWNVVSAGVINFPSFPEQKKIASFLSVIDEKIQMLRRKRELLEKYKKGVMQQLFTGKLRFKEENGRSYTKGEDISIGEIFRFKQGVQAAIEEQVFEPTNNFIRFIRIVDLTKIDEPIRYIKDPGKEHHLKEQDLFMVRYGNPGVVGFNYNGVIANNLFRILPLDKRTNTNFFKYWFEYIKKDLDTLASSSTMPALNFGSLNTLRVVLPTIKEQNNISDYLNEIDKRISAVNKQITQTQTFKKCLLQQMFV